MRCEKLYAFMLILAEVGLAISQSDVKEDRNIDSLSLKTPDKEINLKDIDKKIEELVLLIEDNRILSWNLLKNSIKELKMELTCEMKNSIDSLKMELENKTNSIKELKSEINKVSLKVNKVELKIDNITNEVYKVTNNAKLNIIGQNTIISNELKAKVKRQNENIVSELKELKELNYNRTNNKCINNVNELEEIKNLMKGLAVPAANCAELLLRGDRKSGTRLVSGIDVLCDQDTDGGGWTIFQNRDYLVTPRENFYRNWTEYSNGFGDLSGEFWLGLESIHKLTKYTRMELRVDLEDDTGEKRFAKYKPFSIENSREDFRLNSGTYSGGDAGKSFGVHNQMKFSTLDKDNDLDIGSNCAKRLKGAWWYEKCAASNLNGYQLIGNYTHDPPFEYHGIWWITFRGTLNSMRKSRMMFRPE